MWLKQLSVFQFKNYAEAILDFSPQVNAITGDNGAGKTNILDAIHYLSLCKSYFNPIDSHHITHGAEAFMVQGTFDKADLIDVVSCALKKNQKKQFKKNKKEYERLADHIGAFPLVMITPNDSVIISGGSEERRKFVDNVISQTDAPYLDQLILYNRCLLQRNTLLKQAAKSGKRSLDPALMETLDEQLAQYGQYIYRKRKAFMDEFTPEFDKHYQFLTEDTEKVALIYQSQLQDHAMIDLLQQYLDRDRILERTTMGIHKDDLIFSIHEDFPLKKFGSQGQQKSFLIALKLAQYSYLYQKKGFKPLLLLDDIFDKLDEKRTKKLMQMVSDEHFGQIFITDTDAKRIHDIFSQIGQEVTLFAVAQGKLIN